MRQTNFGPRIDVEIEPIIAGKEKIVTDLNLTSNSQDEDGHELYLFNSTINRINSFTSLEGCFRL